MDSKQYLDLVQQKLGIKSDYALSKALGLTRGAISNFRHERSFLSSDIAIKVAFILNLHPAVVLADTCAERAKNDEEREIWLEISQRFTPFGFVPTAQVKDALTA